MVSNCQLGSHITKYLWILEGRDRHRGCRVELWTLRRDEHGQIRFEFRKMCSVEWNIGRKNFRGREECFIPQSSGREQTSNTASPFLISHTELGIVRAAISLLAIICWNGRLESSHWRRDRNETSNIGDLFLDGPARKNGFFAD